MGMLLGSVLSQFLFAVMVDVVTELAGEGVLSGLLYADDFIVLIETVEGFKKKLRKWKGSFQSKCLIFNLRRLK